MADQPGVFGRNGHQVRGPLSPVRSQQLDPGADEDMGENEVAGFRLMRSL